MASSERHWIVLKELELTAPLGYYAGERKTGTHFLVNLEIETDFSKAAEEDDLEQTLNYERLVEVVKQEMSHPALLIEHAAQRIKKAILELSPGIRFLRLELIKNNPQLGLKTGAALIRIEYQNEI